MDYKFINLSPRPVVTIASSDDCRATFLQWADCIRERVQFSYETVKSLYGTYEGVESYHQSVFPFNKQIEEHINKSNLTWLIIQHISPTEIKKISNAFLNNHLSYHIPHGVGQDSRIMESKSKIWTVDLIQHYFLLDGIVEDFVLELLSNTLSRIKPRDHSVFVDNDSINNARNVYKLLPHNVNVLRTTIHDFVNTSKLIDVYQFSSKNQALNFKLSV